MFVGKIIGGLVGLFALSSVGLAPLGIIIGIAIGHYFDRGRAELEGSFNPHMRAEIEAAFKKSLFPILGLLAKADGRVCENEIFGVEKLMTELGISGDDRREAIAGFQSGVAGLQSLESVLDPFLLATGKRRELHQIFLVYLMSIAFADGEFHSAEENLLAKIAERLGYSKFAYNRLVGMVKAQAFFYQRQQDRNDYQESGGADALAKAYEALGVSAEDSDAQIKRSYRKLMSEYHPDKLLGRGVPEDMVKLATERSQEIQSAYDLIKKARKS